MKVVSLQEVNVPVYIARYFEGQPVLRCFNVPPDGNCGFYLFMAWSSRFRFCPDTLMSGFRHRVRLYMTDKGRAFFGLFASDDHFNGQLNRVWDPFRRPSFYNITDGRILHEDHWCTTTTLEVMACMFGARRLVVFVMNEGTTSVTITELESRTNDGNISPRFLVDIGLERRYAGRINPHGPVDNLDTIYCALIGNHFNLLLPTPRPQVGNLRDPDLSANAPQSGNVRDSSTKPPQSGNVPDLSTKPPQSGNVPDSSTKPPQSGNGPDLSTKSPQSGNGPDLPKKRTGFLHKKRKQGLPEGVHRCCICLENEVSTMNYPCGHVIFCKDCSSEAHSAKMNRTCPLCRAYVERCMPIYYS